MSPCVARADVIAIGPSGFAGATVLTFDALTSGTEVNNLFYGGVTFTYSLGDSQIIIGRGPGPTNNIAPANIVSAGDNTGTLALLLPGFQTIFAYGYAILATNTVASATTITLFSGMTQIGAVSFTGSPDPTFTGGFAGIQSTIPFNRVALTFNSAVAPAFAVDNVRFGNVAIAPEPGSLMLSGTALLCAALIGRRPRRKIR
jgi:hypothetical protein